MYGCPVHSVESAPDENPPATYAIRARGSLDPAWAQRLGIICITVAWVAALPTIELMGQFIDQTALDGFLAALNQLGLPVLSVERLAEAGCAALVPVMGET